MTLPSAPFIPSLHRPDADVFVPDGAAMPAAIRRTTHLCIAAHSDDQEFMAYHGIEECFRSTERWFSGVVVTDGGGSSRIGPFADCSDAQMRAIRRQEQRKAAVLGEYACQFQLAYPSAAVKKDATADVEDDLLRVLEAAAPRVVYLHNPADKHDTHVAVLRRSLAALRRLPAASRPERVYGCEVWRSLDWMGDDERVGLPCDRIPHLAACLSAVFDSQIAGGKRYDVAVAGRRKANATFSESHAADASDALTWAMDLTPLLDPAVTLEAYVAERIARFAGDVKARLARFL